MIWRGHVTPVTWPRHPGHVDILCSAWRILNDIGWFTVPAKILGWHPFKPYANATPMDGDDFDSMEGEGVIEIHEDQQVLEENIAQAPPNTDVPPPVERRSPAAEDITQKPVESPRKGGKVVGKEKPNELSIFMSWMKTAFVDGHVIWSRSKSRDQKTWWKDTDYFQQQLV